MCNVSCAPEAWNEILSKMAIFSSSSFVSHQKEYFFFRVMTFIGHNTQREMCNRKNHQESWKREKNAIYKWLPFKLDDYRHISRTIKYVCAPATHKLARNKKNSEHSWCKKKEQKNWFMPHFLWGCSLFSEGFIAYRIKSNRLL